MSRDAGAPERIRVGPAGWSSQDWAGQVYPKPPPRGFDPLTSVAQYVDTIEINSTCYRIPAVTTTRSGVSRVSDHPTFRLTAKRWQGFTHEGTASVQDEAAFRQAMAPLQEAGTLGAVLMPCPYRVHHTPENRAPGQRLAEAFREVPLVLEIRHRSWDRAEVFAWLQAFSLGCCNIDPPQVSSGIGLTQVVTSPVGYLR